MATAAVISSPPLRVAARSSSTMRKQKSEKKRAALDNVFQVVRRDQEFIRGRLRMAAEPLRPIYERVSGILNDLFWFRFFENHQTHHIPRKRSSWPRVSYPPGCSGLDILIADLEALKTYADYIQHLFQVWTMPLPEFYDPEKVEDYFSCRPHVLMFRILEVLSLFSYAVIRFQFTRIFKLRMKDVGESRSSGDTTYHVGQLLKETMLNLGPIFIKVGQSLSTRPDIIGSESSKALSELHDKIPPFPRAVAMKIIETELGGPVQNYFSYISEETVAAASFGQVYQGCTLTGCTVAVKVQRPNLLHSVVRDIYILRLGVIFNKRREIQWKKILLFLKVGSLRVGLMGISTSASNMPESQNGKHNVPEIVNLIARLLPSRDGAVLRRLLVTADAVSLCEAMISKDAISFRQHISMVLADVIHTKAAQMTTETDEQSKTADRISQFYAIMRDRRLKVIFFRMMTQIRRHPVLMLRSCWSCFTIVVMALIISLSRFISSCSQSFFNSLAFVPRRFAISL